ncbi:hypothetical protein RPPS3_25330 [Rhodopseudomonas palustris]|uniref:hypothetical protein n=1 Tax=Rhodopseudomonas palustris TaxID=1076 RepID=UPI000D1BE1A1|nr:hypothetical protein [Rhodopseudomonas palustris]AVT76596.1 hypothetical protein RPPS3_25330 [Rhodopseudomonas palustris]
MRLSSVPAAAAAPSTAGRGPLAERLLQGRLARLGFAVIAGTDVAYLADAERRLIIRFERTPAGRIAYRDTLAKARAVRAAHDLGIALHRATLLAGLQPTRLH